MLIAALLVTALLFGGMVLYSFGFAAFVFSALPIETAGPTIRRAFPYFYLFVIATSAVAALLLWPSDRSLSLGVGAIALTGLPARQILMPAIHRCNTESGITINSAGGTTTSTMVNDAQ